MSELSIDRTWDGQPAQPGEIATLRAEWLGGQFRMRVSAPFHGDPLPPSPPGCCDGLWDFEVVELFLLGEGEHYVELELGPAGHFLALELRGRRRRTALLEAESVHCERAGGTWEGELCIGAERLPAGLRAWNAYAIHGMGAARRHLAWQPVPGPAPDFHRLECFAPLPRALARSSRER